MSARSMASAVVLWRHSWLCTTALSLETCCRVEDLPFEVSVLFSYTTNEFLPLIKKNHQTTEVPGCFFLLSCSTLVFHPEAAQFATPFYKGQKHHQVQAPYLCPQCLYQSSPFHKRKTASRPRSVSQQIPKILTIHSSSYRSPWL